MTSNPIIATPVADVINSYPAQARKYALRLRALILKTAAQDAPIGALTETLKWRKPSYLTTAAKSGAILRVDGKEKHADKKNRP